MATSTSHLHLQWLSRWKKETEAAIQKCPSSSVASKSGIEAMSVFKHELVHENCEKFSHQFWKSYLPTSRYTIYEIPEMPAAENMYEAAKTYLTSIMKEIEPTRNFKHIKIDSDKNPVSVTGLLSPFVASLDTRPDAYSVLKYQYPLVLIEIHSGNERESYLATIAKTVILVIDQLRLLSNYETTLRRCTGFVFPKSAPESNDANLISIAYTYVTEVTVTWTTDLFFEVKLTALEKESVKDRVKTAARGIYEFFKDHHLLDKNNVKYFMKLAPEDLKIFGSTAVQVASKSSIIVYCDKVFFKCIPNSNHSTTIAHWMISLPRISQVLYPSELRRFGRTRFFKFEEMQPPLSRADAKRCLLEIIVQLDKILNDLHHIVQLAHLDVRLENICFDADKVVLIDLDRAETSTKNALSLPNDYPGSTMYTQPDELSGEEWQYKHSDYRQLGNHLSITGQPINIISVP